MCVLSVHVQCELCIECVCRVCILSVFYALNVHVLPCVCIMCAWSQITPSLQSI